MTKPRTHFESIVKTVSERLHTLDQSTFLSLIQEHESGDIAQLIYGSGYFEATELESERIANGGFGHLSFEVPMSESLGYASISVDSTISTYISTSQISLEPQVVYECDNYGSYMFSSIYQTGNFAKITTNPYPSKKIEDEDYLWAA